MTIISSLTLLLIHVSSLLITLTDGAAVLQSSGSSGSASALYNLALPVNASNPTLNITNAPLNDSIAFSTTNNFPIYCRDTAAWSTKQAKTIHLDDCYSAMQGVFLARNLWQTRPFIFEYLTPNSGHTRRLPIRWASSTCAAVLFPRKLAEGTYKDIILADPEPDQGFSYSDVSNYDQLAYEIQGVFNKCLLPKPDEDTGSGWIPAGLKGELFLGLWGTDGELDNWLLDNHNVLNMES